MMAQMKELYFKLVDYTASLVPPEFADAEWHVKLSYLLQYLQPPTSQLPDQEMAQDFINKAKLCKFFRMTLSKLEITAFEILTTIPILESVMPLLSFLNQYFPTTENQPVQDIKREISWILLNFSSEEGDDRVAKILTDPKFNMLHELNQLMMLKYQEEQIVMNILWFLSNILGEVNNHLTTEILKKTDILDYIATVSSTYLSLSPILLKILPWLCCNIMRQRPFPQVEIVQIVLRLTEFASREMFKLQTPKRIERVLKDVMKVLFELFHPQRNGKIDHDELRARTDCMPHFYTILTEFDFEKIFEACFSSESFNLIDMALCVYGSLLIDDDLGQDIFTKHPCLHLLVLQNILINVDLTPAPVMTENEISHLEKQKQ